jgi:hypothetical protein
MIPYHGYPAFPLQLHTLLARAYCFCSVRPSSLAVFELSEPGPALVGSTGFLLPTLGFAGYKCEPSSCCHRYFLGTKLQHVAATSCIIKRNGCQSGRRGIFVSPKIDSNCMHTHCAGCRIHGLQQNHRATRSTSGCIRCGACRSSEQKCRQVNYKNMLK